MLRSTHRHLLGVTRRSPVPFRPLSSSSSLRLARPPSFTTPEPAPYRPDLPQDLSKPLEPLPPTNLPVEDYASPLLHTASFFSQLFRYAVFGSVALVTLSVGGLVAVHLYVEHVELAAPKLHPAVDDPDEWLDELEGWSGGHTGKGGTDPRLGVLARAAVRGAWISQNWGAGLVASPISTHAAATSGPFGALASPGGQMIGYKDEVESRGRQVSDGGWLMAERYLVFAMEKAAKRGISLGDSLDQLVLVEQESADRAAVELEERLAGLRERIGGRYKLEAARQGWERIYYALAASPSKDVEWERREKLKATRKLGELSARIGELWREGSEERVVENRKAEGWYIGGLVPVLAEEEGQSLKGSALDNLVPSSIPAPSPEPTKHVSPASSFFGFWSRSHPSSSSSPSLTTSTPPPLTLSPELSHLVALIPSSSASPLVTSSSSPATSRAILSSLISLETFLARRRDATTLVPSSASSSSLAANLSAATALQRSTLAYLSLLLAPFPALSLAAPSPAVAAAPVSTLVGLPASASPAAISHSLSHLYYLTRRAALEAHLAECSLALVGVSSKKPRAPTKGELLAAETTLKAAEGEARSVVESVAVSGGVLEKLAGKNDLKKGEKVKQEGGAVGKALGEQIRRVRRDAEKVLEIVKGLQRAVEGLQGGKK